MMREVLAADEEVEPHGGNIECFDEVADGLNYKTEFSANVDRKSVSDRYESMQNDFNRK